MALVANPQRDDVRLHRSVMLTVMALVLFFYSFCPSLSAGSAPLDVKLQQAIQSWQAGELGTAMSLVEEAASAKSVDPRVWYLRGVLATQMGADGAEDFARAARLEVAQSSTRLINPLLEHVQGDVRAAIESARRTAKISIAADPDRAAAAIDYRNAMEALSQQNVADALAAFDRAIEKDGSDARFHYMRGVALVRSGRTDEAKDSFRKGLALENSYDQVMSVNRVLAGVQGEARRMIEETEVSTGDSLLTRQTKQRQVIAEYQNFQRQLQVADAAQREQLMAAAETSRRAREEEAAKQILAAEKEMASLEAFRQAAEAEAKTVIEPPVAPVAEPKPTVPPIPKGNPFSSPTNPGGLTAELPEKPSNPFSQAIAATTVDTSWLAPQSELLFTARMSDILNSSFVSPLLSRPDVQDGLKKLEEQQGLPLMEVESITGGMGDVMTKVMGMFMNAGNPAAAAAQFANNPTAINVVHMKSDFDLKALAASKGYAEFTHGNFTGYQLPKPEVPAGMNIDLPQTAICQVDSRTLLTGSMDALKAALDRGKGESTLTQFAFAPKNAQASLAFTTPLLAGLSGNIPQLPPSSPPPAAAVANALRGKVQGIALGFRFSNSLDLDISVLLTEAAAASDAVPHLTALLQMAQQVYTVTPQGRSAVPGLLQPVADSAVQSLKASASESVLTVSVSVPGDLVTILNEHPELLPSPPGGPGLPSGPGLPGGPRSGNGFPGSGTPPSPSGN